MMLRGLALAACLAGCLTDRAAASEGITERARHYLTELVRLDTTNPPGNETRAASWLKGSIFRSCKSGVALLGFHHEAKVVL